MKHNTLAAILVAVITTLAMGGCGGGGSYGGSDPVAPAPPPPPTGVEPTNFTAFVREQVTPAMTTETALPVDIETMEWVFPDGDSEVYDDVIDAAP